MRRDHIRDYATAAFRFYARVGKLSGDEYLKMVRGSFGCVQDEEKKIRSMHEKATDLMGACQDLDAVKRTLDDLEFSGKYEAAQAVRAVYFVMPSGKISGKVIAGRVRDFSLSCPASERTVYRWLSLARKVFARERGLRL